MSKAFTSEETADPAPLARPAPRLAPGQTRWITRPGRAALVLRLDQLLAERVRLLARTLDEDRARAAALESQARLLADTLAIVTVAPEQPADAARASIGATVTLRDDDGGLQTWQLVGPDEAEARVGKLSIEAPLGRALLGARAGQTIEFARPKGPAELLVESVLYP